MMFFLSLLHLVTITTAFTTHHRKNIHWTSTSSTTTTTTTTKSVQQQQKYAQNLVPFTQYCTREVSLNHCSRQDSLVLRMAETPSTPTQTSDDKQQQRPFWLDPNTKGGALVLMVVLFVVPLIVYNVMIGLFGMDEIEAGITIGIGFTIVSCFAWVSTYVFRVATKDMTYAKQLKDYENAVIAKRLEELDDDEIQALVEEVEKDNF